MKTSGNPRGGSLPRNNCNDTAPWVAVLYSFGTTPISLGLYVNGRTTIWFLVIPAIRICSVLVGQCLKPVRHQLEVCRSSGPHLVAAGFGRDACGI